MRTIKIFTIYIIVTITLSSIGKEIVIDIPNHTLEVHQGIWTIKRFPITTGGVDSPTLSGSFSIINKLENVESYHGYTFPHWLGVYDVGPYQNGIHSVKGQNPWADCIGQTNCTPGSIILREEDMKHLYKWAKENTPVTVLSEGV